MSNAINVIYLFSLLHKLVFPTVESVGNPVGKGPFPRISHGIIPCVKPLWVNIFPLIFPPSVDFFPRIIHSFNFLQLSHKHFPTDCPQFLHPFFICISGFLTTDFRQKFSHWFPTFSASIFHINQSFFPTDFRQLFPTVFPLQPMTVLSQISHKKINFLK